MMLRSSRHVGIALSCLVAGCADRPPPVAPPAPVALVAAAPAEPSAPDLSPVAEPRALVLVARWKSAIKGLDQALGLLGVPFSLETLLATETEGASALIGSDASMDLAVSLDPASTDSDPKVLVAFSVPLTSFEKAREMAEKEGPLSQLHPGVLRLAFKHGEETRCDLAAAAGDAPARLVCGHERDLEALRGWLTRGLPRIPATSNELTATLRLKPIKDRYLPLLRAYTAKLGDEARVVLSAQSVRDAELLAAPVTVLDESVKFLDDLDRLELRAAVGSAPPQIVSSGTVRFGGQSSWLTRVLTDVNDKAGSAPAMFWQVPRDASSATWGHGSDPHLYDGLRGVLHKALGEVLARAPLSPADKELIEAFADGIPRTPRSWVSAQGFLPGAQPTHAPAAKTKRAPAEALADAKAFATGALGWTVVGVDAPAAEYVAWARQATELYARGVRLLHEAPGSSKKGPSGKQGELLGFLPRLHTTTSPPGWPKGTVAIDALISYDSGLASLLLDTKAEASTTSPKKKEPAAKGSVTLRIAIVPDGEHTWIGFSADLEGLKRRMSAVLSGAPVEGTLAAREGLAGLRQPGQTWAGFFSAGALLDTVVEAVAKEKPDHAQSARAALAALPNKGNTPVLLVGSGTGGDTPSNTAELRLQQGTLADLTALVMFLASPAGKQLLDQIDHDKPAVAPSKL